MIYKNLNKIKNTSLKKLNLSSFNNGLNTEYEESLLPINYSVNTYNFNFQNGALKTGLGIGDVKIPYGEEPYLRIKTLVAPKGLSVISAWIYTYYAKNFDEYLSFLVVYCSDKKLYYNVLNATDTSFMTDHVSFNDTPTAINYNLNGEDVIIFTSDSDDMRVWNVISPSYTVPNTPKITSMCIHYERLFVTTGGDRKDIWFSDDLDPTNWNISSNEAGFIRLTDERGPSNKVISLNDYVYVFRDFGISKITAFAKQEQFSVNHVYLSSTKIYPDTVVACGDVVFFMTIDGVYVFDGVNVTKLKLNIENMLNPTEKTKGAYFNGKYYLAVRLNFPDDVLIGSEKTEVACYVHNNSLLEINTKNGEMQILRGVNINGLIAFNDVNITKLITITNDNGVLKLSQLNSDGKFFETPTEKMWESPMTDLGVSDSYKIINEVYIKNKYDCTVEIYYDGKTKRYNVSKSDSVSRIKPKIKGKIFSFRFLTDNADAHISDAQIIYSVV